MSPSLNKDYCIVLYTRHFADDSHNALRSPQEKIVSDQQYCYVLLRRKEKNWPA